MYSFKSDIQNLNKEKVTEKTLSNLKVYIDDTEIVADELASADSAIANLWSWVVAIYSYCVVFQTFKEKKGMIDY